MLISSDETLRRYLPNPLLTAEGETPFFQRLLPFLQSSEQFVRDTFTGNAVFETICQETPTTLRPILEQLIVDNALLTAIPSLDLVLTPNGFGIVSTANLAPASKERIERLLTTTETSRDRNIQLLLLHLPHIEAWPATEQAQFFAATLFPDLSLCDHLGTNEHKWQEYLKWRSHLIYIEDNLANECISPELMRAFRDEALRQFLTTPTDRRFLIQTLRFHEVAMLQGRTPHLQALADIVNIIRGDADKYPEWQNTATAALFSPNRFENTKTAAGYWF